MNPNPPIPAKEIEFYKYKYADSLKIYSNYDDIENRNILCVDLLLTSQQTPNDIVQDPPILLQFFDIKCLKIDPGRWGGSKIYFCEFVIYDIKAWGREDTQILAVDNEEDSLRIECKELKTTKSKSIPTQASRLKPPA